jgi:hypothetical protein
MRDRPTRSQTCRGLIMMLQSGCAIRLKPKTGLDEPPQLFLAGAEQGDRPLY